MEGIAVDVLASLVSSAIGFALGAFFIRLRLARRLSHVERLVPNDRRIQIVLPSTRITDFEIKGSSGIRAVQPSNVLMMPLPEGSGVAQLVLAFRALTRSTAIFLTTDDAVSPDYGLTISVGGPSVNLESKRMLRHHPNFQLAYPEHVATYGDWRYDPKRAFDDEIVSDYGFVFIHKEVQVTKIVCCGVWGAGTEAAIKGLLDSPEKDMARLLRSSRKSFRAFHTTLNGLEATDLRLLHLDDGTRMTTWH